METGFMSDMRRSLVQKVTIAQVLIVPHAGVTLGYMDSSAEKNAFAERLNTLCDEMKVPPKGQARQTTLAGIFEVTQKGARKWLEGEGYPSMDMARRIAVWGNVQIDWLLTGRGLKHVIDSQTAGREACEPSPSYSVQNISDGPDIKKQVPLISFVKAGNWSEAVDIYEPGYAERWLPFFKNNGDKTFALRVTGDSMTAPYGKSYPEGCIIFVDPDRRSPTSGDRVIAKMEGTNQVTFKVFIEDAGRRWLKPLNPQHLPILDPFNIIGTVVGKWEDD